MKTALVTGANRGLGREVCRQLAGEHGMRVIATSRNDAKEPLDVSISASVNALAARLADDGTRIDVLVNNAGIYDDTARDETLAVNFHGAMRVTNALLPLMNDAAAIVMVSSGMGELSSASRELRMRLLEPNITTSDLVALIYEGKGWPSSAYRVSKMALNTFTRILARDLARSNSDIRVNAVCPGWVRTDMGGAGAPRDVTTGAASIVAGAFTTKSGTFSRDGREIAW